MAGPGVCTSTRSLPRTCAPLSDVHSRIGPDPRRSAVSVLYPDLSGPAAPRALLPRVSQPKPAFAQSVTLTEAAFSARIHCMSPTSSYLQRTVTLTCRWPFLAADSIRGDWAVQTSFHTEAAKVLVDRREGGGHRSGRPLREAGLRGQGTGMGGRGDSLDPGSDGGERNSARAG